MRKQGEYNGFDYHNHLHENDHIKSKLILGNEDDVQKPLVSVIMPVYNHPDFFRKSLLSVINQKCNFEYEIIIIDNDHPDFQPKNQAIVQELLSYNIRYYVNAENIGGVGSENRGVQLAKGEYISFCHDDDMLYEDALQNLINTINKLDRKSAAIFGHYVPMDENDNIKPNISEWNTLFLRKKSIYRVSLYDFLLNNYTNGCGALFRKSNYLEIGGFNSDYIPCPDYALNIYYTKKFGAYAIKNVTMKYRVTMQSDSSKVYDDVLIADRRIKEHLLDSELRCKSLLKACVDINMKCQKFHQYRNWSNATTSNLSSLIYRIANRIFLYVFVIIRSFR